MIVRGRGRRAGLRENPFKDEAGCRMQKLSRGFRAGTRKRNRADRASVAMRAAMQAAKSGPKPVRTAAIGVIGRLGDASSLPTLLAIATDDDDEIARSAKAALTSLPGKSVDAEIAERLRKAEGKTLAVLAELVGQRRIDASDELVKGNAQFPQLTVENNRLV